MLDIAKVEFPNVRSRWGDFVDDSEEVPEPSHAGHRQKRVHGVMGDACVSHAAGERARRLARRGGKQTRGKGRKTRSNEQVDGERSEIDGKANNMGKPASGSSGEDALTRRLHSEGHALCDEQEWRR